MTKKQPKDQDQDFENRSQNQDTSLKNHNCTLRDGL